MEITEHFGQLEIIDEVDAGKVIHYMDQWMLVTIHEDKNGIWAASLVNGVVFPVRRGTQVRRVDARVIVEEPWNG